MDYKYCPCGTRVYEDQKNDEKCAACSRDLSLGLSDTLDPSHMTSEESTRYCNHCGEVIDITLQGRSIPEDGVGCWSCGETITEAESLRVFIGRFRPGS